LSPSIFKILLSLILDEIRSNYFIGLSDVSYLAYADDLLLLHKYKQGLSFMVLRVSRLFSKNGLNIEQCEFLVFNGLTSSNAALVCCGFSIPLFLPFGGWVLVLLIQCLAYGSALFVMFKSVILRFLPIEGSIIDVHWVGYMLHSVIILPFMFLGFFPFLKK
jgi:hypothetical protein